MRRQKEVKRFRKSKFTWKNTMRLLLLVVCGITIGINVYLANANSLVGNQLPMPFGYGLAVVLSGSMEPELSIGDLLFVKETEDYKENDIVVFQEGNTLIVHRVIEIDGETITTKGDANNIADEPINISSVKGKMWFCVPYVGKIVEFLKTPVGTFGMIAAAIALVEIPRRNEKRKDEREHQKIIDEINHLKSDM